MTAIAVGVLFMKGVAPGPRLFVENPVMPTSIIMCFFIANLLLFPLGYVAIKAARHVLSVPRAVIVPMILVCCFIGSFAVNNTLFGVWTMLVAGLVGYVMERNQYPIAPVILGLVLGPVLERNFISSMQISHGNLLGFFERPVSAVLGVIVCSILLLTFTRSLLRKPTPVAPNAVTPDAVSTGTSPPSERTFQMMSQFSVQDRVAVVTGGLGQLGTQFTKTLAEAGAKVAIFSRRPFTDAQIAEKFPPDHADRIRVYVASVTDKAALEAASGQLIADWGVPHILINNAGIDSKPDGDADQNAPFEDYPQKYWDEVIDTNLTGVMLTSQVLGAKMAEAGRGSIIMVGSMYGMVSPQSGALRVS